MKNIIKILTAPAALVMLLGGCNRASENKSQFDNQVYIYQAESNNTASIIFKDKDVTKSSGIQAALALPSGQDVKVNYAVDLSLVENYAKANYMECVPMPTANYTLEAAQAIIPAGSVRSPGVNVDFINLGGLERDINYVLPVSIQSAEGVGIMNGAKTIYYVLRKGATINYAMYMGQNYFSVPGFDTSPVVQGLTQVTFEVLLRPHVWKSISSIMGIEDYFLIRFGDTYPTNRVQLAHASGNAPSSSTAPVFNTGEWQHFAMTYDVASKALLFYSNGVLQPTSPATLTFAYSLINLGVNQRNGNKFMIGYSYDESRWYDGDLCEMRIWNVTRTQQQIADNVYDVDPKTPGLVAYWKFDEGKGSTVADATGNGNYAVAKYPSNVHWIKVALP